MSAIKLYLDEDAMDRALVRALRARQIDVLSALEAGMLNRSDREHLLYASRDGRVLYSFNMADYQMIHTEWSLSGHQHAGIVVCPHQRLSAGDQARRLIKLVEQRSAGRMRGRIEYLGAWKV